ncbi:MAG: hypothetical protein KZQ65_10240, partial [Candidatus Thiodiazotropha sp. (ex Gloverina cf. vestifex)]|nr:hypothetical protein [Candidatus Thiodiazotropha sp. (ex Gloverina cf. vestifex)]
TIIPQSMDSFRASLTVTITAIQPRLRLSGINRLGFQPSMAISDGLKSTTKFKNWWYDYRISYVDTKSFADYRTLYFKNGELIKIIDRDWGLVNTEEEGDPRALFWKYWYGLDLRTGHESLAVIPKKVVEYNSNRRNSFWTEKTLRKIKR